MGVSRDSFILAVPTADIDADITVSGVDVNPIGSGSVAYSWSIAFTYVTGNPPASAFRLAWTRTSPPAALPSAGTFAPTEPVGIGNMVRSAIVSGTVGTPAATTVYHGRLIIKQA